MLIHCGDTEQSREWTARDAKKGIGKRRTSTSRACVLNTKAKPRHPAVAGLLLAGFGPAAEAVLEEEAPDHEDGFVNDLARDLGGALEAVGKDDGNFDDFHALPPEFVCELDLEAVAVGANGIELDGFQGVATEAFEAAGRIAERHAGDDPHVEAGAHAEHEAREWPVDDADAVAVAGTDDEVGVFRGVEKFGDVVRVMGEVTVHLHDIFVAAFKCPGKARTVGAPEAVLLGAMQHLHLRVLGGEVVGDLSGAVGGVVIHHEEVDLDGQRKEFGDERGKVIPFVVGRHND